MPFGSKPKCSMCKSNSSSMWRKNDDEEVICNACSVRSTSISNHKSNASGCPFTFRKSTRVKSSKLKQHNLLLKAGTSKGKSRRQAFKKSCTKAPPSIIAPIEGRSIFYEGTYFQIGDIVAVTDVTDSTYYAQIRGLLQDQYCEKSAVLTWLLPTQASPKGTFDPETYIIGPEEDIPRKLECMDFVCHSPSEHYMATGQTYPILPPKPQYGFQMSKSGLQIVPLPEKGEMFTAVSARHVNES